MHRLSSCSKTNIVFTCACTRTHPHLHILIQKSIFQGILYVYIWQNAFRKGCCLHRLLSVPAIINSLQHCHFNTSFWCHCQHFMSGSRPDDCGYLSKIISKDSLFKWPRQLCLSSQFAEPWGYASDKAMF